jgi:hypothetical protein
LLGAGVFPLVFPVGGVRVVPCDTEAGEKVDAVMTTVGAVMGLSLAGVEDRGVTVVGVTVGVPVGAVVLTLGLFVEFEVTVVAVGAYLEEAVGASVTGNTDLAKAGAPVRTVGTLETGLIVVGVTVTGLAALGATEMGLAVAGVTVMGFLVILVGEAVMGIAVVGKAVTGLLVLGDAVGEIVGKAVTGLV